MSTPNSNWDVERAQAWLRRHAWGDRGEQAAPARSAPPPASRTDACDPALEPEAPSGLGNDEIDIACWPALVAPFYD